MTRAQRNFNPGNVRHSSIVWQGQAEDQTQDPAFVTFTDFKWGIRTIAKILINYEKLYHLNTIRQKISRWAPSVENDTEAYVNNVANECGCGSDDPGDLFHIVKGIVHQESGSYIVDDETIQTGIDLAEI